MCPLCCQTRLVIPNTVKALFLIVTCLSTVNTNRGLTSVRVVVGVAVVAVAPVVALASVVLPPVRVVGLAPVRTGVGLSPRGRSSVASPPVVVVAAPEVTTVWVVVGAGRVDLVVLNWSDMGCHRSSRLWWNDSIFASCLITFFEIFNHL